MDESIEIEIKISNKSLEELQNTFKKLKVDIPVKPLNDFTKSVNRFANIIKQTNSHINNLIKGFNKFQGKFNVGGGSSSSSSGVKMEEIRLEKEKQRMERDRLNNESRESLAIRRSELELQKEREARDKANAVAQRVNNSSRLRMMEKEHNMQLQYRKKEFTTFVNEFQRILSHIPVGSMIAPMLGRKTQGLLESSQQIMLYKQHKEEIEKAGTGIAFPFQARVDKAREFGIRDLGKTEKESSGMRGWVLDKAGKMLSNPMAMMGGAVAIGIIGKAVMFGLESSPMFQQLVKLTKFGFMLLLRPIGDFFGFLFRPILILLLRKFIIPFYKEVYPFFVKWGTKIGEGIVGILEATQHIGKILEMVFKGVLAGFKGFKFLFNTELNEKKIPVKEGTLPSDPKTPKAGVETQKSAKIISETNKILSTVTKVGKIATSIMQVPQKIVTTLVKTGVKVLDTVTPPIIKTIIKTSLKPVESIVTKVAETTAVKTGAKMATKAIPVVGQALLGIDAAGSIVKSVAPDLYAAVREGARSVFQPLIGEAMFEGASDFLGWGKQSTAEQFVDLGNQAKGWLGFANGGIIREPIMGVGTSGRKYTFGERGAERITPISGNMSSGTSNQSPQTVINITVNGNIMSDRDMLNFQRVVMRAVETSNTRRAKL